MSVHLCLAMHGLCSACWDHDDASFAACCRATLGSSIVSLRPWVQVVLFLPVFLHDCLLA